MYMYVIHARFTSLVYNIAIQYYKDIDVYSTHSYGLIGPDVYIRVRIKVYNRHVIGTCLRGVHAR